MRQGGFTLVELVTVIIILGILSAVVAPRFFEMADDARIATNEKAVSDGIVHFNLAYMRYVVESGTAPSTLAQISGSEYLDLDGNRQVVAGDYRYTYTQSGAQVTIAAQRSNGSGGWDTALSQTIEWP